MLGYTFELELWNEFRRPGAPAQYFARLRNSDGSVVSYARLLLGYSEVPNGVAICDVETHPDYRRQGLATYLLRQVESVLGPVYTSGMCSRSGEGLIMGAGLKLNPGARVSVHREDDYRFVDWESGYPLPW